MDGVGRSWLPRITAASARPFMIKWKAALLSLADRAPLLARRRPWSLARVPPQPHGHPISIGNGEAMVTSQEVRPHAVRVDDEGAMRAWAPDAVAIDVLDDALAMVADADPRPARWCLTGTA